MSFSGIMVACVTAPFHHEIEFIKNFNLSSLEDSKITSFYGKVYERVTFESPLEEFLSSTLCDQETSSWIYQQYKEIILPAICDDPETLDIIISWIKEYCCFLQIGSPSAFETLKSDLRLTPYMPVLETFLKAVNMSCEIINAPIKKIAIVIPTPESAEDMVAKAMEASLIKKGYTVKIISEEQDDDPMYHFSGMSIHDYWKELNLKRRDIALKKLFRTIMEKINYFLPSDSMGILRRRVEAFEPDFVFTTRHQFPTHLALARKCQMAYILCDYGINDKIAPIVPKIDPLRIKICVPAESCVPDDFKDRIFPLGLPIRLGIKKEETILMIKEKWNIRPEEKVVMLLMGRHGMKGLANIIQHVIIDHNLLPPTVFIAITGNNLEMKNEITSLSDRLPKDSTMRIQAHGALDEYEMSDVLNMASVAVGKSGGSATAELIAMSVYGILFPSSFLEQLNINYLQKIDLAVEIKEDCYDDIVPLILEQLRKEKMNTHPIDWESQLDKLLS